MLVLLISILSLLWERIMLNMNSYWMIVDMLNGDDLSFTREAVIGHQLYRVTKKMIRKGIHNADQARARKKLERERKEAQKKKK